METQFVITGGIYFYERPQRNVSLYDMYGLRAELPPLNIGRENHGCGYYRNQNDQIVIILDGWVQRKYNI